jgi:DNA replication protein DnaC
VDVSWPMVGRQAELEALVADISEARGGVVLAGAAGVGKTRLASATFLNVGIGGVPV